MVACKLTTYRTTGCRPVQHDKRKQASSLLYSVSVYEWDATKYSQRPQICLRLAQMEVTKALAALQPLYGKGNVEIVTRDGHRVRGIVRSMKTTQALTTPSVKVERGDGQIVKVPFSAIVEIINHNPPEPQKAAGTRQ